MVGAQMVREKAARGRNWMMPGRAVRADAVVLLSEDKCGGGRGV